MSINSSGDLTLKGDASANQIEMSIVPGVPEPGVIRGTSGTLIRFNGQLADEHTFNLTRGQNDPINEPRTTEGNVTVSLGNGNDSFVMGSFFGTSLSIGGDLKVNLGAGQDQFLYQAEAGESEEGSSDGLELFQPETHIYGTASIVGQKGRDIIDMRRVSVSSSAVFNMGAGHDVVSVVESSIGDSLQARATKGPTAFTIHTTSVADDLDVKTGSGDDEVTLVNSRILGDVSVSTGSAGDFDHTIMVTLRISGDLAVKGGGGLQFLDFGRPGTTIVIAGSMDVRLGGGDDRVSLVGDITCSQITVKLGGGNDRYAPLNGLPGAVDGNVTLIGNGGNDLLNNLDRLSVTGILETISFEEIV